MRRFDSVSKFLLTVLILIAAMTVVGGITRLTGSGLSITEWKPIMGAIPPLTDTAWDEAFSKYKQIPQYSALNSTMTMSGFKAIFFWEYLHRLIGRAIGLVYFFGLVFLWAKAGLTGRWKWRLVLGLLLGGLQGVVGWIMVASGLSELVYVSHYRLALHLGLAFFVFSYLLWLLFSRIYGEGSMGQAWKRPLWRVWTVLLTWQILYGAFVAGLKAGYRYNEFPFMGGSLFPPDGFLLDPPLINWVANPSTVQFVHRMLAWTVLAFAVYVFVRTKKSREAKWILHPAIMQFLLGIATLLLNTPIWLAALHQFGALILLAGTVAALHSVSRDPASHENQNA